LIDGTVLRDLVRRKGMAIVGTAMTNNEDTRVSKLQRIWSWK
jgi:hypothetical protein